MKNKIAVAIYTRVSTQEQATDGYSIGEQKERLEKYTEAHDWIIYKVYTDPGFSGGSTERPGLQQLIRDAQRKKFDKVVVYKLDRLSRSQKDTLFLIEDVFLKNDVDFVSMTENFDTSTPLGRAMIGILSVFAQLEREQIKERMQVGLDGRAKEGYFHGGGFAPIGYDYIDGELVINEYEALQIRKIYELAETGLPVYSVYKYMRDHNYSHKHGKWTDSAVRSCLTSIIYTGKIRWKGELYPGRHQAIIDEETFNNMQNHILNRDLGRFKKHPFQRTTLLGGIIFCGNCGARYYCKHNVSKRPDVTPAQRYYTCYSRGKTAKNMIKDPNCKNKSWNIKDLDNMVLDEIRKLATDPGYMDTIIEDNRHVDDGTDRQIMIDRLADIDKQISKLVDLYQIGGIDFNAINEKIVALNDEKASLELTLDNEPILTPDISLEETKQILSTFSEVIDVATPEELRDLVHSLIDGIVINGEDLEIHWKFI